MSAQKTYSYATQPGVPGGIADISPYSIDTFLNEEDTGKLQYGMAVVQGTVPGQDIKIAADADGSKFEGVTVNSRGTELDLDGITRIRKGASVGVMRWGKIYVRVVDEAEITYGSQLKINVADEGKKGLFDPSGTLAVSGRFLSAAENGVALAELFNPSHVPAGG